MIIVLHSYVILTPFGGSITNKVVTTLEKSFNENCISTIKFNFRGVGRSTGKYGHGALEIKDLKFVFDAFKNIRNFQKFILLDFPLVVMLPLSLHITIN